MPLLLAAASAKELQGVSGIFPASTLYLRPQLTSTLLTSQPQHVVYPYSPFNFLPYQLSKFPNLQPFFFSPSLQVEYAKGLLQKWNTKWTVNTSPVARSNMFLRAVNILGPQQLNGTRGLLSLAMMSLRTSSEAVKNTAVTQGFNYVLHLNVYFLVGLFTWNPNFPYFHPWPWAIIPLI